MCVLRGKKWSFFGKLGVLCFLATSVLRFAVLPYYRRIKVNLNLNFKEQPAICFVLKIKWLVSIWCATGLRWVTYLHLLWVTILRQSSTFFHFTWIPLLITCILTCKDSTVFQDCTILVQHYTAWKVSKYGVFSGPYFPVFGLNTEIYGVNLRIKSKYRKLWTRKNSVFGIPE